MEDDEKLKRLGGGRWETKDGRYSIEPESGTWVVVDNEQTNELGLPLVRGPFPTLTAAREAVQHDRGEGPARSPLAERIRTSRTPDERKPRKPEPAPQPRWLEALGEPDRRRVRTLVKRLEAAGIPDAEDVARAEIADGQPALARVALERRLGKTKSAADAVKIILAGRDDELGARWRLVDGNDHEITRLDLPD
jgi:nucleotide-binding universal stress UspA family protein